MRFLIFILSWFSDKWLWIGTIYKKVIIHIKNKTRLDINIETDWTLIIKKIDENISVNIIGATIYSIFFEYEKWNLLKFLNSKSLNEG